MSGSKKTGFRPANREIFIVGGNSRLAVARAKALGWAPVLIEPECLPSMQTWLRSLVILGTHSA